MHSTPVVGVMVSMESVLLAPLSAVFWLLAATIGY